MLRDKQTNIVSYLLILFTCILSTIHIPTRADLTSLAKNDAIPVFSTLNWDDLHLLTKKQLEYRDYDWAEKKHDRFTLSISPFAQNADRGKTIRGQNCTLPNPFTDDCGLTITDTPLGDLTGRTPMISLLYNDDDVWPGGIPTTEPEKAFAGKPTLLAAYKKFFTPDIMDPQCDPINPPCNTVGFNSEANIDPHQLYGFFSFPLKYRKRGVRFDAAVRFYNFGLRLQTGFATIRQVREATIDLTNNPDPKNTFVPLTTTLQSKADVEHFLMEQLDEIAEESNIGLCDFIKTSAEETRFYAFWQQAFAINEDADTEWAKFLIIPYIEVGGGFSPGKKETSHKFFSAPFGNNGHSSAGFTAGFNLDFKDTIEIGGEAGYTHFFKKDFCNMPVPNSEFQMNLYPFSTDVSIQPGDNWYFGARIAAYHFVDNLSMYFEWFVLDHQKDEVCVKNGDPAFVPEVLECISTFKTKLGNAGFNYDLSPNIGIGFLWQIPFSQRNSYRSSTIMAGLNVTF
jgi:hypothetical protein